MAVFAGDFADPVAAGLAVISKPHTEQNSGVEDS